MYTGRLAISAAKKGYIPAIIILAIILSATFVFAESRKNEPIKRRASVRLKHISSDEAIDALKTLNLGSSVTPLPKSPETLVIISDSSAVLDKARLVLEVIDSERKYDIRTIKQVQTGDSRPDPKEFTSKLPGFEIGSFEIPPISGTDNPKILIDVLNSNLIVIAPADSINMVSNTIGGVAMDEATDISRSTSSLTAKKTDPNTATTAQPKTGADEVKQPNDPLLAAMKQLAASLNPPDPKPADPNQTAIDKVESAKEEPAEDTKEPTAIEPAEQPKPEPAETEVKSDDKSQTQPVDIKPATDNNLDEKELEMTIKLPTKVEILVLIDLVGEQLQLNYIYDPLKFKTNPTVMLKVHEGKIKVKNLYSLLESVLRFKGYVMTRRGSLVTITDIKDAANIEAEFKSQGDPINDGEVVVAMMFELKHIDTASAAKLLNDMKLSIKVEPIQTSDTIIVTGYAYLIPKIEQILKMVDIPGEPREFEFKQLNYTLAANLVQKLQKLTEQLESVTVTIAPTTTQRTTTTPRTTTGRTTRPTTPRPSTSAQKPVTKKTVYIDVDERTNRILMIGSKKELATVNELIETLDIEKVDPREIHQYEIENVAAEEVEQTLLKLGIISRSSTSQSSTRRTSSPTQRPPTSSAARPPVSSQTSYTSASGKEFEDEAQVVVLESTNSLLVNGTPEQHDKIAMIVGFVDDKNDRETNPYVIYSLENQDPEVMAETLTQVIKETSKKTASSDPKIKTTTVRYDEEDEVIIVPDINTFSLIVYASRKQQAQIAQLIEVLDKRRPQVLIDATLVAITKDDNFQYDLDLITKLPEMVGGNQMDVLDAVLGGAGSETFFPSSTIQEYTVTSGVGRGFYADNHIQALLTLVETNNYGRVLSQPKILVNDNETGTINAETTTYVARSSSSSTVSGEPVISSSFTFDEFTSGINLEITPHISEGDLLRLEISLVRSKQESAQGNAGTENVPPPDRTENNITTVVTVPDQSTIILGGVQQIDQNKYGSKVPFLGDLPLIGTLFRSVDNSDKHTKIYIFLRANILRPDETESGLPDLVRESDIYRAAYEESEQDWQEHETWPGVKPDIVKPEKFLDVR